MASTVNLPLHKTNSTRASVLACRWRKPKGHHPEADAHLYAEEASSVISGDLTAASTIDSSGIMNGSLLSVALASELSGPPREEEGLKRNTTKQLKTKVKKWLRGTTQEFKAKLMAQKRL